MKNIFLSFLILAFSPIVWGDGGGSCDGKLLDFDQNVLFNSNCLGDQSTGVFSKSDELEKKKKTCGCLREQVKTNALLKSISETAKVDENALEKSKTKYKEKFFSMYEKMTVGASVQAKILGLDDDLDKENSNKEKIVGCTPSDVSSQVKLKSIRSLEVQFKDLTKLQKENQKNIDKKCSIPDTEECLALQQTAERIKSNLSKAKDPDANCSAAIELLLEKMKGDSKNKDIIQQTVNTLLEQLRAKDIEALIATSKKLNIAGGAEINCSDVYMFVSKQYEAFKKQEDEKSIASYAGETIASSKCEKGDMLCEQFEQKNADILQKTQEKYGAKSEECITQAEFDTFKAMPNEALLTALAESKHPERLLILPKTEFGMTEIERGTTNFLRSNPIIAKMVLNKDNRSELGQKLKTLAKSLNKKDDNAGKYKAYLNFMKDDVKKIANDKEKMNLSESFVCDKMASSFTAIQIANDLPFEEEMNQEEQTQIGKLQTEFKKCDILSYRDSSTTDLYATLNQNPVFNLGVDKQDSNLEEKEFSDLKASICGEYPKYVANECKNSADDSCRINFLKRERAERKMAISPADFNFVDATVDANQSKSIKTNLDNDDIKNVSRYSDESQQDHEYKDWWNENVGSKMDQNVMARPGHYDEFEKSQRQNESIAFSAKAPESLFAPIDPVANTNSNSSANAATLPGQQIPEYAKDIPSFDTSKLANATSPKDLIPNYDSLAPFKQKESLNQVKEYIASKPNSPITEESVDEEISNVNKKIAANIKEIEKKIDKISSPNSAINSPSMPNGSRSAPSFSAQNNVPSMNRPYVNSNSNSSGGGSAKINTRSQSSQATNKALIQANESRVTEANLQDEGRSPASLLVQDTINFQKGVFDPALLQPGLLINEEILVPDSHDKYEKIKTNINDLKKYLSEQIDPKTIKGPKIYRIRDPKESPNSYILFYVSKGSSGEINVKTVNRKSTLRDLNNSL